MHTVVISSTERDNFFDQRLATNEAGAALAYLLICDATVVAGQLAGRVGSVGQIAGTAASAAGACPASSSMKRAPEFWESRATSTYPALPAPTTT
jgi:hypothetical protein